MNEETKGNLIAIIIFVLVVMSICAGSYLVIKDDTRGKSKTTSCHQSRSDLCYSLKVNRIMLEDYKDKYGIIDGIEKFESALIIIENRNWMECEE